MSICVWSAWQEVVRARAVCGVRGRRGGGGGGPEAQGAVLRWRLWCAPLDAMRWNQVTGLRIREVRCKRAT